MRIAHATDIHWNVSPPLARLPGKRMFGAVNLLLGRGRHYSNAVQRALVQHLIELETDAVVLSGDLTQTSLESEFEAAHHDLAPLLEQRPTFLVPGNHDVYTRGARNMDRVGQHFGPWLHRADGGMGRLTVGNVTFLGLDPCRPGVLSSGLIPDAQLTALARMLRDPALADQQVVLVLHYPVLSRSGDVYDGVNHGLRNASQLIECLDAAPKKPALVLHGHVHRGYTVPLELQGASVPIYNCGSSGYGYDPEHNRVAHMNVYEIDDQGLVGVERFFYDGTHWALEPGGPYASGR